MGNSTTDIVARLMLNGSQFGSESARIFGEMEARARDTATRTKNAFEASYQNIQQIAQRALAAPRNASGSFDLNVAGAREAAVIADAQAAALRQVATAAEEAARKTGDLSENTRIYLQAARAAAIEAENVARTTHQEANALDLLQQELNQTASATELVIEKNRILNATQDRGAVAAKGHGMAMMQAGQQVQDFFIQVGGGQNVMMAFIMQASQAAYVLQSATGATSKWAAALTGGWGTAVLAGASLLVMFGDKIFDTKTELEKATEELVKNAEKTRAAKEAQEAYAKTAPGVIDAINKEWAALQQLNLALEDNVKLRQAQIQKEVDTARTSLKTTEDDLAKARKQLSGAQDALRVQQQLARRPGEAGDRAALGLPAAQGNVSWWQKRVTDLEKQKADLEAQIVNGEKSFRAVELPLLNRNVDDRMSDEAKAAATLRAETEKLTKARIDGLITEDQYEQRRLAAKLKYEAEVERIRKRQQAEGRDARDGEMTTFISPVAGGRQTGKFGEQRGGHRHGGIDIAVPVGTNVSAAAGGTVIESGRMGNYGNVVVIDHGGGTITRYAHLSSLLVKKGDTVGQGDRIGLSGGEKGAEGAGNSQGPHLHYEVRQGGKAVDPSKGQYRTDGYDVARKAKEEADQRDRILAASREQLSIEVEQMRYFGLRVQGLDQQAETEVEIAKIRRDSGERLARLSEADRKAQQQVSAGLDDQIAKLLQQGEAYAGVVRAAGDRATWTDDEKAAIAEQNTLLMAQLETAYALAETEEDRARIQVAMVQVQGRLNVALEKGVAIDRERAQLSRELKNKMGDAVREVQRAEQDRLDRERDQIDDLAHYYRNALSSGGRSIAEDFKDEMFDVIAQIAARWTLALLSGQKTSLNSILSDIGATSNARGGGGLLGALGLFGGGGGAAGGLGGIKGALGAVKGGAGGALGAVSSAVPYVAAAYAAFELVSGILPMLQSPKWGGANLTLQDGQVAGGSSWGKGSNQISAAAGSANSVAEGINRLAEQLGATITGIPGLTVGSWNGRARVALTSTSAALHSKNFGPDVLKDFGEDEQAAMAYAIQYAFTHAALDGISQASKNIIAKGGTDIEKAISKALMIEDIPKRLKAYLDPVGYAVDELNKKWAEAIKALEEGGASAQQMAEAQQLYRIELEETKAKAREASADLKDFFKSLNFGSASPYSLRDQEAMAKQALDPYLAKIAQGQYIDQAQYREAAQAYLDIERQLYGSTSKYFDALNMVQAATGKAIGDIDNAKPIRTVSDPFVQQTATNTQTANELLEQMSATLVSINSLLGQQTTANDPGFVGGSPRLFTRAANP